LAKPSPSAGGHRTILAHSWAEPALPFPARCAAGVNLALVVLIFVLDAHYLGKLHPRASAAPAISPAGQQALGRPSPSSTPPAPDDPCIDWTLLRLPMLPYLGVLSAPSSCRPDLAGPCSALGCRLMSGPCLIRTFLPWSPPRKLATPPSFSERRGDRPHACAPPRPPGGRRRGDCFAVFLAPGRRHLVSRVLTTLSPTLSRATRRRVCSKTLPIAPWRIALDSWSSPPCGSAPQGTALRGPVLGPLPSPSSTSCSGRRPPGGRRPTSFSLALENLLSCLSFPVRAEGQPHGRLVQARSAAPPLGFSRLCSARPPWPPGKGGEWAGGDIREGIGGAFVSTVFGIVFSVFIPWPRVVGPASPPPGPGRARHRPVPGARHQPGLPAFRREPGYPPAVSSCSCQVSIFLCHPVVRQSARTPEPSRAVDAELTTDN